MEVFECIRRRRTVREFKPDPVPDEVVHKLLQAGRWAPSSRNGQPWHYIVIRSPQILKQIGEIAASGSFVARAPLAIAIVMDGADRPDLDAGRALQQMELVAWDEGMGTCFVGLRVTEQNQKIKQLLGIPDNMELVTVLPFGYRAEGLKGRGQPRKPLSEVAHTEKFGQPYQG